MAFSHRGGCGHPMGLGCIAFASFALPDQLQSAAPLVPALRSSWLVMHVSVIMVSYAALLVGSLLSLAVLLTDRGQTWNSGAVPSAVVDFVRRLLSRTAARFSCNRFS